MGCGLCYELRDLFRFYPAITEPFVPWMKLECPWCPLCLELIGLTDPKLVHYPFACLAWLVFCLIIARGISLELI